MFVTITNTAIMIRAALFLFVVCTACQSGKIPCPEVKTAKMKESRLNKSNRFYASPSRMMASTKGVEDQEARKKAQYLEHVKSSRTTGKEMLERYGTVEEWDCPSPTGKKKHSKVTKENIRKNEKKIREHMKEQSASDSLFVVPRDRR